jgi:DNA processing protein
MDIEEQLYWLVLSRLRGCSPSIRRHLQLAGAEPLELLNAPAAIWRSAGAGGELLRERRAWQRQQVSHPAHQQALRDAECLQREQAQLLILGQPGYPAMLAEIYDPPPLLYLAGSPEWLQLPQLAVVGSRRCAASSRRAAYEFAGAIVRAGLSVTSGLALGVDTEAHRGALAADGPTIAVMATGIDRRYPRRNVDLAAEIRARGLLLTEFPPGSEPKRQHFPMRNRLISGLSLGVLVVEGGLRSGSLITARQAMEQNREVFALPHSIFHEGGRGCHQLIRQGAKLVEQPQDIFEELGALCAAQQELQSLQPSTATLSGDLARLYSAIGHEPVSVDELVLAGAGEVGTMVAGLVELQAAGLVDCSDGLYMRK